ncbi:hypothetical protein SAMN04488137_3821 [Fictibacillus solisalsi]|uniref:Uncharacterized protein n=1 Tax=Fictibacillus solisalsi TaxID=459525 RepID=A0A1G9ZXK0_9BACL|nr:hypothetical protein [Fictibacillus solisalsi]SDN26312.1 hypothetical protein SAMN04488137_3821 [Fictibacillus solisalsi]
MKLFNFFSKNVPVYTAFDQGTYFKVAQRFQSEGLRYKVKRVNHGSWAPGSHFSSNDFNGSTFYEFFVKSEEEHKAYQVLSNL